MNLTIHPSAQEMITKRGSRIITAKIDRKSGGCGRPLLERIFPSVDRGKPKEKALPEYREISIGEITVFAHKSMEEYKHLEIYAANTLLGKKLFLRCVAEDGSNCFGSYLA